MSAAAENLGRGCSEKGSTPHLQGKRMAKEGEGVEGLAQTVGVVGWVARRVETGCDSLGKLAMQLYTTYPSFFNIFLQGSKRSVCCNAKRN